MPFCFARRFAGATRIASGRGGSRERGFSLRTESSARFYELMSISVPDGTPEELVETAEAIAGYVTAAGGRVLRSSNDSPWGRRRLAYPIRHNSADLRDGFYTLYHFEIEPEGIESIEREIRLNERIIRHLLLQLDSEPIFVEEEETAAEGEAAEGGEVAEAAVDAAPAQASESTAEVAAEPVVEASAETATEGAAPAETVTEPVAEVVEVAASEEE
jgi:small subunit ribosomal protein S6